MVKTLKPILFTIALLLLTSTVIAEAMPKFVSLEEQVLKRAIEINIPRLELKETTLAQALDFLRQEAVKRDPKHIGIQIDSKLKAEPVVTSKTTVPPEGRLLHNPLDTRITLSLRNVSLAEALRHVTALANCDFVFTANGIAIVSATEGVERLVTHTIPLSKEIFGKSASPEKLGVSKSEIEKMRADLNKYFIDRGVSFSPGASCSFDASGMTMTVTNTMEQIDLVHAVLEGLVRTSPR